MTKSVPNVESAEERREACGGTHSSTGSDFRLLCAQRAHFESHGNAEGTLFKTLRGGGAAGPLYSFITHVNAMIKYDLYVGAVSAHRLPQLRKNLLQKLKRNYKLKSLSSRADLFLPALSVLGCL
ncbi:unnamed protein product [Albugo candida]|uniref:Uncharacterized protein n=1 Tax=Albugo candida TaxID=65357 RepID=A0A024FWA2_9STRA|nr:unnamed protein product [Albugo candida]|eukprot:CCI10929.1 unnamed protein product [Albugo candida]